MKKNYHLIIITIFILIISACGTTTYVNIDESDSESDPGIIKGIQYIKKAGGFTIEYKGAFNVPYQRIPLGTGPDGTGYYGSNDYYGSLQGSGHGIAYNHNNNTLLWVGRCETSHYSKRGQIITELTIPEPVIGSIEELKTAELATNYIDCVSDIITEIKNLYGNGEGYGIGGLMVFNNNLIGTIYRWHNCSDPIPVSHFYSDLNNYNKANTVGPLAINAGELNGETAPAGAMAGYMSPIPEFYQAAFGYPALTGSLHGSVIGGRMNRCSNGPAAFGFNPADFITSGQDTIQGSQFIYHSLDHLLAEEYHVKCNDINGMAFISNNNSIPTKYAIVYAVVFGNPPYYWNSGYRATSYDAKLYFYQPEDLLKVKNNELTQYQLTPYATLTISEYFYTEKHWILGMAYDHSTNRLFITEKNAYNNSRPVVHVFELR